MRHILGFWLCILAVSAVAFISKFAVVPILTETARLVALSQ